MKFVLASILLVCITFQAGQCETLGQNLDQAIDYVSDTASATYDYIADKMPSMPSMPGMPDVVPDAVSNTVSDVTSEVSDTIDTAETAYKVYKATSEMSETKDKLGL